MLVIAGTTESKMVIEQLLKEGKQVVATTATALGTEVLLEYPIEIKEGRRTEQQFIELFKEEAPAYVVDASHPFAVVVTETVKKACERLKISYRRVEREVISYDYDNIIWVEHTDEAIAYLNKMEKNGNILLTTGSNTLNTYVEQVIDGKQRIYARVLDHEYSHNACKGIEIGEGHIIYQNPPFSKEETYQLLKQYDCQVLVTKDSGKAGGVEEKVEACKELNLPVIMIKRPPEKTDSNESSEKKQKKGLEAEKAKEKKSSLGALMIAGTGSGCGKTTVVCALMKALKDRGVKLAPFKCGPDYIDPMLHRKITDQPSNNLDAFFMDDKTLNKVFYKYTKGRDLALIEGVMGFYDGMGLSSGASSYEISEKLKVPVLLVVSARGMSATLSAIVKGMKEYKPNQICGVLLNQCSKPMYERLKTFLLEETGIPVVGYLPVNEDVRIKERHLGLMTAEEIENLESVIKRLGQLAEQCFELDNIMELAKAFKQECVMDFIDPIHIDRNDMEDKAPLKEETVKIAVAKDPAFCFCYEDNLEYLKEQGAELLFFRPLYDKEVPKDADAIYLVGGYPELYGKELSQNKTMLKSLRRAVEQKTPILAECGGYLYLCEKLMMQDEEYELVGAIPQTIVMTNRLNMQFGYIGLTALEDGLLAKRGEQLKAHEFHYSKEEKELASFRIEKGDKSRSWTGGYHTETMYAGYPHFHFRSNEQAIKRFLETARILKR